MFKRIPELFDGRLAFWFSLCAAGIGKAQQHLATPIVGEN
jgi:hypothetical protein